MLWVIALLIVLVLIAAYNAQPNNPVANSVKALSVAALWLAGAGLVLAFAGAVALFVYWAFAVEGPPRWAVGAAIAICFAVGLSLFSALDGALEARAARRRAEKANRATAVSLTQLRKQRRHIGINEQVNGG